MSSFLDFERSKNSLNVNKLCIILKHAIWRFRFRIYNLQIFRENMSNNRFCEIFSGSHIFASKYAPYYVISFKLRSFEYFYTKGLFSLLFSNLERFEAICLFPDWWNYLICLRSSCDFREVSHTVLQDTTFYESRLYD